MSGQRLVLSCMSQPCWGHACTQVVQNTGAPQDPRATAEPGNSGNGTGLAESLAKVLKPLNLGGLRKGKGQPGTPPTEARLLNRGGQGVRFGQVEEGMPGELALVIVIFVHALGRPSRGQQIRFAAVLEAAMQNFGRCPELMHAGGWMAPGDGVWPAVFDRACVLSGQARGTLGQGGDAR